MNIVDLGTKDYKETWDVQKKLHDKRVKDEIADTVLLVEHEPVITMGKSGKEKNVLIPQKLLKAKGIAYYNIERGGDVTYHGPGQLVGYPIFNIKKHLIGVRSYIEKLEQVIIETLADFGIQAETRGTMIGVWTEHGKICSIGVAVKQWVSFHGFALNVNTDLHYFDLIVPCGLKDVTMTSMQKILGHTVHLDDVKKSVKKHFGSVFEKEVEERWLQELI